jgi:hypothetical protein
MSDRNDHGRRCGPLVPYSDAKSNAPTMEVERKHQKARSWIERRWRRSERKSTVILPVIKSTQELMDQGIRDGIENTEELAHPDDPTVPVSYA